jgi:PAS domain S-box-containing protein
MQPRVHRAAYRNGAAPPDTEHGQRLRSALLQNTSAGPVVRQRAEQELLDARTALKKKTTELSCSLAMTKATLESTTDAIIAVNAGGTVTDFNQNFAEMWDISREQVDSNTHLGIVDSTGRHFDDPAAFRARIEEIYATSPSETEDVLHLIDGRVIERFSKTQRIKNKQVGRVWSFRDITEREQIANVLRESEERLRATIDSALDCIVTIDEKSVIVDFNPAAEATFKYRGEEVIGKAMAEMLIPPHLREGHTRGMALLLTTGESRITGHRVELSGMRSDGSEFPLELTVNRMGMQEPPHFTAFMRDITERKRNEAALQDREEHLRFVIEASNDGIWEWDIASGKVTWSDQLYGTLGLSRQSFEPSFETKRALIHPDDVASFDRALEVHLDTGHAYRLMLRYRHSDGSYLQILSQGRMQRNQAGQPVRMIGSFSDLTRLMEAESEKRRADEAVWASKAELHHSDQRNREQAALLDLAHDAIMVRSMDDRVLYWNQGAEKLYGWGAKEVIGELASSFLYDNDAAAVTQARSVLLEEGQWNGERTHLRADGGSVVVRSRWTLVLDEYGEPKSILIINTDITEQKKIEEQFLRAQRLESIGTLASGVAHDLNNILCPILMSAPLLRSELRPELKERLVSTIEQSAERGAQIVKQVLTFARGVEGERILIDPGHLIKEMTHIAEQTFPKSTHITTRYPEDLWLVEGDPTQLHQVLLNLCLNARDAMSRGGTLVLSAENFEVDEHFASMMPGASAGPHVLVTVSDTGEGIPREIIHKIFDPFFTTKGVGKGTGLGLSTVLGIVQTHDGFISIATDPGNGTTFKVYLPATSGVTYTPEVSCEEEHGNGETVLVVDDEPAIVAVTKLILESNNYRVFTAEDGPDALAVFAEQMRSIDLVITDLLMPYMDGAAVIRSIKKMKPSVRIIASTGQGEEERHAQLETLGVASCLTKPYNSATLLATLRKVFDSDRVSAGGL